MKQPRHSLSNKDLIAGTADCAICGRVRIFNKSSKAEKPKYRCEFLVKKYNSKAKGKIDKTKSRQRFRKKLGIDISEQEYQNKLLSQNGVCAICMRPPSKSILAVDHCHTTGKIRKLLCTNCNLALGLLKDSTDITKRALEYLMEFQGSF